MVFFGKHTSAQQCDLNRKYMKKKLVLSLLFLIAFGSGIGLGFYIRTRTIDPRATIPNIFEKVLSLSVRQGQKEDEDLLYYDTNLFDFIVNGSKKTKVAVVGIVDKIAHEPDGDYHVIIRNDSGLSLVTEFIPEIKLLLPKKEDRIKIWGIVRFDYFHNWWELHPVIGWETVK